MPAYRLSAADATAVAVSAQGRRRAARASAPGQAPLSSVTSKLCKIGWKAKPGRGYAASMFIATVSAPAFGRILLLGLITLSSIPEIPARADFGFPTIPLLEQDLLSALDKYDQDLFFAQTDQARHLDYVAQTFAILDMMCVPPGNKIDPKNGIPVQQWVGRIENATTIRLSRIVTLQIRDSPAATVAAAMMKKGAEIEFSGTLLPSSNWVLDCLASTRNSEHDKVISPEFLVRITEITLLAEP
jgi:hypothetical protein